MLVQTLFCQLIISLFFIVFRNTAKNLSFCLSTKSLHKFFACSIVQRDREQCRQFINSIFRKLKTILPTYSQQTSTRPLRFPLNYSAFLKPSKNNFSVLSNFIKRRFIHIINEPKQQFLFEDSQNPL